MNTVNTHGKLVAILKSLHLCMDYSLDTQNFAVSFPNGAVETEKNHYTKKVGPKRKPLTSGDKKVKNHPLVNLDDIPLPPVHINKKAWSDTFFVKAMPKYGNGFVYLKEKFLKLSETKIKEGIFVKFFGSQLIKF